MVTRSPLVLILSHFRSWGIAGEISSMSASLFRLEAPPQSPDNPYCLEQGNLERTHPSDKEGMCVFFDEVYPPPLNIPAWANLAPALLFCRKCHFHIIIGKAFLPSNGEKCIFSQQSAFFWKIDMSSVYIVSLANLYIKRKNSQIAHIVLHQYRTF